MASRHQNRPSQQRDTRRQKRSRVATDQTDSDKRASPRRGLQPLPALEETSMAARTELRHAPEDVVDFAKFSEDSIDSSLRDADLS